MDLLAESGRIAILVVVFFVLSAIATTSLSLITSVVVTVIEIVIPLSTVVSYPRIVVVCFRVLPVIDVRLSIRLTSLSIYYNNVVVQTEKVHHSRKLLHNHPTN